MRERDAALTLAALTVASGLFGLLLVWGVAQRREEEKRQSEAEFQERLVAILGHDLRSPLASIETTLQVTRRKAGRMSEDALQRMETSSARMGRMIEQLLDLARIRLGDGIRLEATEIDLCNVVRDIVGEHRSAHLGRTIEVEDGDRIDGCWDADRLAQVISNLLGNALAYGAHGSPVRVSVAARGDMAVLTVHNDGPPIPSDVLGTLFDPFRRGGKRKPQAGSGLGLGLFITKELVLAHKGTIDVSTNEQSGTTFTVTVPRRAMGRGSR